LAAEAGLPGEVERRAIQIVAKIVKRGRSRKETEREEHSGSAGWNGLYNLLLWLGSHPPPEL
jgi:transcription initiation factor TFIIIB Brf1 subunit/transcription initiation factor TFIIB